MTKSASTGVEPPMNVTALVVIGSIALFANGQRQGELICCISPGLREASEPVKEPH